MNSSRQIHTGLLAIGLLLVSFVLIWMLNFRPVVYEISVYLEEMPTPAVETIKESEPVSPRERELFRQAQMMSRFSY